MSSLIYHIEAVEADAKLTRLRSKLGTIFQVNTQLGNWLEGPGVSLFWNEYVTDCLERSPAVAEEKEDFNELM